MGEVGWAPRREGWTHELACQAAQQPASTRTWCCAPATPASAHPGWQARFVDEFVQLRAHIVQRVPVTLGAAPLGALLPPQLGRHLGGAAVCRDRLLQVAPAAAAGGDGGGEVVRWKHRQTSCPRDLHASAPGRPIRPCPAHSAPVHLSQLAAGGQHALLAKAALQLAHQD